MAICFIFQGCEEYSLLYIFLPPPIFLTLFKENLIVDGHNGFWIKTINLFKGSGKYTEVSNMHSCLDRLCLTSDQHHHRT